MSRLLSACALFGLFAIGCGTASDPTSGSSNKLATTPPPSATATPASQPTQSTGVSDAQRGTNAQGDVTGAYFVEGRLPDEFAEIEHLSLATINDQGDPAPLNGFIRPKRRSAQDYKLVSSKLSGKTLTFSTTTVGGVSYSFTGAFEKLNNFAENPPPSDEVVLRGKLTKTRDGNVVAESDVNFTYSAGG